MYGPFSVTNGVFEVDAGRGTTGGPRIIDPAAGLVRFADPTHTIPIADVIAVAVVWVERDMKFRVGRGDYEVRPTMVHSVVLVLRRAATEVHSLLGSLARHAGVPVARPADIPQFSMFHASLTLGEGALALFDGIGANGSRRAAKAVARLLHLPMIELYGEHCVYRVADGLDLRIRDWMQHSTPPPDPGAPPQGLEVARDAQGFTVSWNRSPSAARIWFFGFMALFLVAAVPLIVFVEVKAGLSALLFAFVVFLFARGAPSGGASTLRLDGDRIELSRNGAKEAVALDALEMLRLVDTTVVLVDQADETRVELKSAEAARWLQSAIQHGIVPASSLPYR